ncbi:MAG TPA: hypothetical protein DFS52_14215 [Myxococcales bacterium]|jgi:hypothetical protein|nr:hypothetical protein [Myxococcales bacterium]
MSSLSRMRSLMAASRGESGQATVETAVLVSALLVGAGSIMFFLPDMLAAFTIYIQGFYLVLGYPIG